MLDGSGSTRTYVVALAITLGMAAFSIRRGTRARRVEREREALRKTFNAADYEVVQLTPDESHWDWLPAHVSITTLTFFKGDTNAAYAGLRQRLKALVAANPWLCGRIIKVPGAPRESCCELWVPKVPDYSTLIAEMESEQLVPGQTLEPAVWHRVAFRGRAVANKDAPLFKVTVIRTPRSANHDFCLMVSMNHTLGDAHTFYTIHQGLGECAATPVMNVTRKVQEDLQLSLVSKSAYQVNTDWVNAEKARYQEERAASGHTDSPPFVSTNDVLASWFFKTGGYAYGHQFVNCRNRLGTATSADAGNYLLTHVTHREAFATAGTMRASFKDLRPLTDLSGKPWLPVAELLRLMESNFGSLTNWTAPHAEIRLPECVQVLHHPVLPVWLASREVGYLFRPTPDTLGVGLVERVRCNGGSAKLQRNATGALGQRLF